MKTQKEDKIIEEEIAYEIVNRKNKYNLPKKYTWGDIEFTWRKAIQKAKLQKDKEIDKIVISMNEGSDEEREYWKSEVKKAKLQEQEKFEKLISKIFQDDSIYSGKVIKFEIKNNLK